MSDINALSTFEIGSSIWWFNAEERKIFNGTVGCGDWCEFQDGESVRFRIGRDGWRTSFDEAARDAEQWRKQEIKALQALVFVAPEPQDKSRGEYKPSRAPVYDPESEDEAPREHFLSDAEYKEKVIDKLGDWT